MCTGDYLHKYEAQINMDEGKQSGGFSYTYRAQTSGCTKQCFAVPHNTSCHKKGGRDIIDVKHEYRVYTTKVQFDSKK
jgi:hypothetical protein